MRILKFLIALLIAAAALTAGALVFVIVAAVAVGALLIRWGMRRFGLSGTGRTVAPRESGVRPHIPASEATIDVVATESRSETIDAGDSGKPAEKG